MHSSKDLQNKKSVMNKNQHHLYQIPTLRSSIPSQTILIRIIEQGFPDGSDGKKSACNAGDPSSILGSGRFSWRREWQPTPVFLPGEFPGQRILLGYAPWGPKQLETTERLTLSLFHFLIIRHSCKYIWCSTWRRLLRVPWIARRSNQSVLKEISPGISLEGMMLKLKLQCFGHLM